MLMKPWRDLRTDLKSPTQSWSEAFQLFMLSASERVRFMLSGIQYFHECDTAAKDQRNVAEQSEEARFLRQVSDDTDQDESAENVEDIAYQEMGYSEEGLASLIASQTPIQEEIHARMAVEIAKRAKLFSRAQDPWAVQSSSQVGNASGADLHNLFRWKEQMKRDIISQDSESDFRCGEPSQLDAPSHVAPLTNSTTSSLTDPHVSSILTETALLPIDPSNLNADQLRAYNIIVWHLDQTLSNKNPRPLRMIIYGEGGTGKSKVIQTVTETFASKHVKYMLVKSAP